MSIETAQDLFEFFDEGHFDWDEFVRTVHYNYANWEGYLNWETYQIAQSLTEKPDQCKEFIQSFKDKSALQKVIILKEHYAGLFPDELVKVLWLLLTGILADVDWVRIVNELNDGTILLKEEEL